MYKSIYEEAVALGIPHSNHDSDLLLPETLGALELIKRHDIKAISRIKHGPEQASWINIPYHYDPFWERLKKSDTRTLQIKVMTMLSKEYPDRIFSMGHDENNKLVLTFDHGDLDIHDPFHAGVARREVDPAEYYGISHDDALMIARANSLVNIPGVHADDEDAYGYKKAKMSHG